MVEVPPDGNNKRRATIREQIEGTAAYNSPGLYAFGPSGAVTGVGGGPSAVGGGGVAPLLTFYQSLTVQPDELAGSFLPLSSVTARGRNPKLFAVGVLPPYQNVPTRLLDRSRTSAAINLGNTDDPEGDRYLTGSSVEGVVSAPGYQIGQGTGDFRNIPLPEGDTTALCTEGELAWTKVVDPNEPTKKAVHVANGRTDAVGTQTSKCTRHYTPDKLYRILGEAYVRVNGRDPTPTELQFYTAQCLRETSGSLNSNNFGQIGNWVDQRPNTYRVQYTLRGKNIIRYFRSYPTLEEGADAYIKTITTRNPRVVASAQAGDCLGYLTSLAQQGYFEEPVNVYYPRMPGVLSDVATSTAQYGMQLKKGTALPKAPPDLPSMSENNHQYQKRVKGQKVTGKAALFRFNEGSPYNPGDLPTTFQGPSANIDWKREGSSEASQANKERATTANTDLKITQEALNKLEAQKSQIRAIQVALQALASTPPLRMLVNPEEFTVKSSKIVQDGNWGRNGPIIEFWGDDQDKISGSGKVAAFYSLDLNPRLGQSGGPGINRTARNYSAAWQNFQALWLLYRSNGGMYLQDLSRVEKDYTLSTVGSIYIYYDNILYIGAFDSFNVTESADTPFTVEYSFEFTVRAAFLLESPTDQSFGAPDLFADRSGANENQLPTLSNTTTPNPLLAPIPGSQILSEAAVASGEEPVAENTVEQNVLNGVRSDQSPVVKESPKDAGNSGLSKIEKEQNKATRDRALRRFQSGAISYEQLTSINDNNPVE